MPVRDLDYIGAVGSLECRSKKRVRLPLRDHNAG